MSKNPDNLYQRGGVWWIRYTINGVKERRSLGTKSRREAIRLRNEILGTRDAGADIRAKFGIGGHQTEGAPVPTFGEVFDAWYQSQVAQGKAPGSLRKHRGVRRTWLDPIFGRRYLSDISETDVEHLIARVRSAPGRAGQPTSPDTVANVFGYVRRVYRFARRRKLYLGPDPTDLENKPKPGRGRDVYLSEREASQLLDQLRPSNQRRSAWTLYYMTATALFTGLRWGEVNGLRWDDVELDSDAPTIRVVRSYISGPPKSAASRAEIRIHAALAGLLRVWRDDNNSDWLFPRRTGRPLKKSSGADERKLAEAAARAGIKKHVTPHVLRHTFGTHVYARTLDPKTVQSLLRHSRISITMERYVHQHADQSHAVNQLPDFTATVGRLRAVD